MQKSKVEIEEQEFETESISPILNFGDIKEFQEFLMEHNKDIIVAKFYKDNCPFCVEYTPVFEELQKIFKKNIYFTNVNVNKDVRIKYSYRITDLPTTLIIKEGTPYYRRIGVIPYLEMEDRLKKIENSLKKQKSVEATAFIKI